MCSRELGFCRKVIINILKSENAKKDIQRTLCSVIIPNISAFERVFKDKLISRLCIVFEVEPCVIEKLLTSLSEFNDINDKNSFLSCINKKV